MNFEYAFPPTSPREIENFEEKYNIKLPDEYKQFLLLNNGGKAEKRRFVTNDGRKEGIVESSVVLFFPLFTETKPNLEEMFNKYNLGKVVPSHFFPIGYSIGESLVCLLVEGEEKGNIYYCDMDYFEQDNGLLDEEIKFIAKDFSTFLNELKAPPKS
ncbi:SMI1/KNR4 family protein [Bacillus sp. DX1.1]|uniref:SMI1/KNR4 family protein n=1 Tax=unclassified Bacillus (in: firmicutes) TaxID=185979 RepID=UPI002570A975|nr:MULTISPECIES: SMI1/KNR4 family protein [unclassified Bacillus (in: firmicutes)]MDM5154770.1 SMI1/KNR4 family protein [Bacillus sp. DX1.1]WJE83650.1 SMI1/KNR4 family protein [Bacillus sp. DX3.1]